MGSLLCTTRRVVAQSPQEALRALGEIEEVFEKRVGALEKRRIELGRRALEQRANKKRAFAILKQRKQIDVAIDKTLAMTTTISALRLEIEQATLMVRVVGGIKESSETLSSLNKSVDATRIDKILDDAQQQIQLSADVIDAISDPSRIESSGAINNCTEEELEQELAELSVKEEESPRRRRFSEKREVPSPTLDNDDELVQLGRSMVIEDGVPLLSGGERKTQQSAPLL